MKAIFSLLKKVTFLHRHSIRQGVLGSATVQTSFPSATTLLFFEKGVDFTNTYRWNLHSTFLTLEHLRYGTSRPIFLLNLFPTSSTHLASASPHVCSRDTYSATLDVHLDHLILTWSISGPHKSDRLTLTYTC